MTGPVLRTFIAIDLDESLRISLHEIQNRFKRQVPPKSVKWVAPEGIHLTLKFLGDTEEDRLREIFRALIASCEGFEPFDFSVEGRGCFPNMRRPRVVWVAVKEHGKMLARLQDAVEKYVAPLGWPREERPFSPHLTLGRIAHGATSQQAAVVGQVVEKSVIEQIGVQQVLAVQLIQSELRPTGAVYTTLYRAPLGPNQ